MSLRAAALAGTLVLALPQSAFSQDRPEPLRQGEQIAADNPGSVLAVPYSQGVRRVGHQPIEGRDSNVQLVWAGRCAYVSSTAGPFPLIGAIKGDPLLTGVAVIDVRDPVRPRLVKRLRDKGSIAAVEAIAAVAAPDGRMVLAAGAYHGGPNAAGTSSGHDPVTDKAWLDIYDVSDCANPKLMAETAWPENAHSISLSPDGRTVYGTAMSPFTGGGGLQVMDISDMAKPRFLGKFGATGPDGETFEFASHEISFSADGRRIYAGINSSKSEHFNRGIPIMPPNARALGPEGGGVFIFDNSDLLERRQQPRLRLVGAVPAAGWHSAMPARIGGKPYMVGGAELGGCPGTWPKITSLADETKPVIVGEFRLAMNYPENCPARSGNGGGASGILPSPLGASLHYNDVDSATDTRLGLFNFMWAGLRIADLRDPANPAEVAYFKPGDVCTGHVRYVPRTGHIWVVCNASGFHVLELAPNLRRRLGLPRVRPAR